MQNLEQIRAMNALKHADVKIGGKEGGEVVKKVPTMIMENGLLGALAFALEDPKNGHSKVFEIILGHLKTEKLNLNIKAKTVEEFAVEISGPEFNSSKLRAVTAESLNFLNYLRRFVKRSKDGDK